MANHLLGTEASLSDVLVRPVRDVAEQAQWDQPMSAHRYLGFKGLFGGGLRHVAEPAVSTSRVFTAVRR